MYKALLKIIYNFIGYEQNKMHTRFQYLHKCVALKHEQIFEHTKIHPSKDISRANEEKHKYI